MILNHIHHIRIEHLIERVQEFRHEPTAKGASDKPERIIHKTKIGLNAMTLSVVLGCWWSKKGDGKMNELVIMKNKQAVTSTINVANNFEREHHNVIKGLETLKEDVVNFNEMFFGTVEPDSYGRDRKVYLMNRDGFTLLAMGFTGKKATEFKLKYINAFNEMENQLKKPNSTKALLQASLEHEERLETVETDVNYLKDSMRISSREEGIIQNKAKRVVVEALGGKKTNAYKTMSRKVFSRFWGEFKRYFVVARYGDVPKKEFDNALDWIDEWQPDTSTRMEIKAANQQISLEDDAS